MANDLLKVAVIEGWHPFDVVGFRDLFRAIPGIDPYHQVMENWAVDVAKMRKEYDVLVFYNMNDKPEPECAFCGPAIVKAIDELGETEKQGIVFLHHAILAYPGIETWGQAVGRPNRNFGFHNEQTFTAHVEKPGHPIMKGITDWEMFDETYTMDSPDPQQGNEILLTTDYEKSMKVLALTRQHKNSRVFCFQMGHDNRRWVFPEFRKVLGQGIQWAAGKL